jgi:hypothetical protein
MMEFFETVKSKYDFCKQLIDTTCQSHSITQSLSYYRTNWTTLQIFNYTNRTVSQLKKLQVVSVLSESSEVASGIADYDAFV